MKKFSIFLSLLVASFFLLSQNVKAAEYNYSIPDSDFDYVSSSDFIEVRQATLNYLNQYNDLKYYVIFFSYNTSTSQFDTSTYYILFSAIPFNITPQLYSQEYRLMFKNNYGLMLYSYNFSTLSINAVSRPMQVYCYLYPLNSINKYLGLLDANFDIFSSSSDVYNFSSNYYNFTISSGSLIPTLFYIYSQNLPEPDNTPILTTFYTTVGSKIAWLGEQFTESYIYLAILGVFILIFLIELIRRYLL